jgi:hypothetical protein
VALLQLKRSKATLLRSVGDEVGSSSSERHRRDGGRAQHLPMRRALGPSAAALRAAAWHDVITARRLVELGMRETTVYARCRDGGPWQRLLPGIVLLHSGPATEQQRVVAALLHGGPDARLTGLEACRRHGVRRGPAPDGSLHVLNPHQRQVRNSGFVVVERTLRLPAAVLRGGIPLAPLPRALMDAVRRIRSERDVTELMADAVQRGLCTVAQLGTELTDSGRHGTATPRRVLTAIDARARSAAERDAQLVWRRTGLAEPWWNAAVHDAAGTLLGIADAWWDDVALAWEINSYEWHLRPADYAREQAKSARMAAAGVPVLPTLPSRLRHDRAAVAAELRSAYAHAAARPRPTVRAVKGALTPPTMRTPRPRLQQGGLTAAEQQ